MNPYLHGHTELGIVISQLGMQGGLVTPAVYDTARYIFYTPHPDDRTFQWLCDQQCPDGGWGDPAVPMARDMPTLAAVIALCRHERYRHQVSRALVFLHRHVPETWKDVVPLDIPVAAEILIPHLLGELQALGYALPAAYYLELRKVGALKLALITRHSPRAGSAAMHSWDGWGRIASLDCLDGSGGVGHSPAATLAWLAQTELDNTAAARYLQEAHEATGAGIPGLLPTVWPIYRFEQVWGLFFLGVAGLFGDKALQGCIDPHINAIAKHIEPHGIGMSDTFVSDGDITSTALIVLFMAGREVNIAILDPFCVGNHVQSYRGELQPSLTTTAHALHIFALLGHDTTHLSEYLAAHQRADGCWHGDKWHSSWLYTTSQVLLALIHANAKDVLASGVVGLLRYQQMDGGWGKHASTLAETAYAVLALHSVAEHSASLRELCLDALRRAKQRLSPPFAECDLSIPAYWIGKELYTPPRVDTVAIFAAHIICSRIAERERYAHS